MQCRRETVAISETVLEIENKFWHIIDVSGQRERRWRWANYFEKVHAIIYVLSGPSYCKNLAEDQSVNRLVDAIELYSNLLCNPVLHLNNIILFINKVDLLDETVKRYRIAQYLPNYSGGRINLGSNDKKSFLRYLHHQLTNIAKDVDVYSNIFKTTATDPNMMKKVIASVSVFIVRSAVVDIGLAWFMNKSKF